MQALRVNAQVQACGGLLTAFREAEVSNRYVGSAGKGAHRYFRWPPDRGFLKACANRLRRAQDRRVARGDEPTDPRSIPTDGCRWALW